MPAHQAADPLDDAVRAARLFLLAPRLFGGMVLRGASPAREALVAALGEHIALRRVPGHVDDERLLGGIDLAASLAAGAPVRQRGLIAEASGGALLAGMAERMDAGIAGRLAQALDDGSAALVLCDDAVEPGEGPPASLSERLAFRCDLSPSRRWQGVELAPASGTLAGVAPLDAAAMTALAATAESLGVESLRALIFAGEAARALAALDGRSAAGESDLAGAVRLVIAPRATRLPPEDADQPPAPQDEPPPPPDGTRDHQQDCEQQQPDLSEILVEVAKAAIPADLLAQLAQGKAPRHSNTSGTGHRRKAATRGKPLGARPGMPGRGGAKLALIDSLRAAVPWQPVRRREQGADAKAPIIMHKQDLRIRRFEERSQRLTIFAVDASGSAAAARLAEAKGAVELMLAQAYVTRSEVALVAFRGETAELLLPPTRSLTRARRSLCELPGGGGTPLAMGLNAARECAEAAIARGRSAALVILTDGRANIAADGSPSRVQAREDAEAAARAIHARGIDALVVDISARPGPEGAALAAAMGGRFLALPRADARTLQAAISAVQAPGKAA
ncbi:MAG: magnesium chelatase subunit D [Erythrobacter sp.]